MAQKNNKTAVFKGGFSYLLGS